MCGREPPMKPGLVDTISLVADNTDNRGCSVQAVACCRPPSRVTRPSEQPPIHLMKVFKREVLHSVSFLVQFFRTHSLSFGEIAIHEISGRVDWAWRIE